MFVNNINMLKVKKPLIERRRRERINEYLNELMMLVHEATGTKVSLHFASFIHLKYVYIEDFSAFIESLVFH